GPELPPWARVERRFAVYVSSPVFRQSARTDRSARACHGSEHVGQRQASTAEYSAGAFSYWHLELEELRPGPAVSTDLHSPGFFPSGNTRAACLLRDSVLASDKDRLSAHRRSGRTFGSPSQSARAACLRQSTDSKWSTCRAVAYEERDYRGLAHSPRD